jgi:tRNA dimethylallyltransferase
MGVLYAVLMDRPIILILGPTASGKTSLSLELAARLPGGGECICADSMQVYRGMDIGTAKPSPAEQAAAPHHLLDIADPGEDGFTLDRWLAAAEEAIADIRSRGAWPIVVGGTSLYAQALLFGVFEGPPADPDRRAAMEHWDNDRLAAHLQAIDPESAAKIHRNDRRRMIRAIEVHEQTGTAISEHQSQWDAAEPREDAVIVGLDWPTPLLNQRINARVLTMMEKGLVEEVETLAAGGLGKQAAAALGYRQLFACRAGTCSKEEAVEQIKIQTRRFAKQQRSWLRRFRVLPRAIFLPADSLSPQALAAQAITHILVATLPPATS